ncbi:hypothetical protein ACIBBE_42835 [Streptomyces sp. NPDC051644]|uniref:hypothetical protein n=1 Tax=Streptomyces sp. NPDC051644 TaxID=3365666 RepID=UPI003793C67B
MTAGVIHTIRCDQTIDGEQCNQEWYAPLPMANHRELRAHLRKRGWRRKRDGRDLCPDHAQETAR